MKCKKTKTKQWEKKRDENYESLLVSLQEKYISQKAQ